MTNLWAAASMFVLLSVVIHADPVAQLFGDLPFPISTSGHAGFLTPEAAEDAAKKLQEVDTHSLSTP